MLSLKQKIKAEAKRLGFSFIGFSPVKQTPHFNEYENWVNQGMAGEMNYLSKAETILSRRNPGLILNNGKTVIVLGMGYRGEDLSHAKSYINDPKIALIASFALYPDYHVSLNSKCRALVNYLKKETSDLSSGRVFIDSAPVMEKDFAFQAGLGTIGKNSLFIHPETGSYCLLACIFINISIDPDHGLNNDPCGSCQACINACPTNAINSNRTIDARKCISYLTIENRGVIPPIYRQKMGNLIFGCDLCQMVCPLNQTAEFDLDKKVNYLDKIHSNPFTISDLICLDKNQYTDYFKNTPVLRASYEQFLRNILVAAGNSKRPEFEKQLHNLLFNHPGPIIRVHAAWALNQMQTYTSKQYLSQAFKTEQVTLVRREIERLVN